MQWPHHPGAPGRDGAPFVGGADSVRAGAPGMRPGGPGRMPPGMHGGAQGGHGARNGARSMGPGTAAGRPGGRGAHGGSGVHGPSGSNGAPGPNGARGVNGAPGANGSSAPNGAPGARPMPGARLSAHGPAAAPGSRPGASGYGPGPVASRPGAPGYGPAPGVPGAPGLRASGYGPGPVAPGPGSGPVASAPGGPPVAAARAPWPGAGPERVVARLHSHGRGLVLPALVLIAAGGVLGFASRGLREEGPWLVWALLAGFGALLFGIVPVLGWLRNRTVVTTASTTRYSGLLRNHRVSLHHAHVADVRMRRNAWQALYGSGTVVLTAIDGRRLELFDVPNAVTVTQALRELTGTTG